MTGRVIKNHAASIREHLLSYSKQHGDDFQRVLTRYAIERILYRLSQTEAAEVYTLKGAMLFVTWPKHALRPTSDLDLLGEGDPSPDSLRDLFIRICGVELPEDGILFDPATLKINQVREVDKYQGAQVTLKARLGYTVIDVRIDIGFGDYVYPMSKRDIFPPLLPGLPEASILMYPPETFVAEKFEAMVRFGELNSRIKDFYDIWVTTRIFAFNLANLVEAMSGTLRRRETNVPTEGPIGLTDAFAERVEGSGLWEAFLRRTPPATDPPSFRDLQKDLRRFLAPIIAAMRVAEGARGRWDPIGSAWH